MLTIMDVIDATKRRLGLVAITLLAAGCVMSAQGFDFVTTPFERIPPTTLRNLEQALYYGGPALAVFGIVALILRAQVPSLVRRENGVRDRSVPVTIFGLLIGGGALYATVMGILSFASITVFIARFGEW
jgi:hypothetical protein